MWWLTIVSPTGKEDGLPTQLPLRLLERIVRASCLPAGVVLDCFAGSGTTGVAAHGAGRRFILVDHSLAAMEVMARRLVGVPTVDRLRSRLDADGVACARSSRLQHKGRNEPMKLMRAWSSGGV
ncbi:MAG: site-specific DNA-methyltransferase [Chloroflexia bacterium]